jgi:peptidoglycan/xylan/chitin deacetylase (PgdA/CDA1 family)
MLRPLVKTGVAAALHWSRADRLLGRLSGGGEFLLVVGYHNVVADFEASVRHSIPSMLISKRTLERQLDWIGRRFRFVSLDEIASRLEHGAAFDGPVAAVTFDDGYSDVFHNAFPMLKRKGIPAGIFVVTDNVGTAAAPIYDRLHVLLLRAYSAWPSPAPNLRALLLRLRVWPPDAGPEIALRPVAAMRQLLDRLTQADLERVVTALEEEFEIGADVLEALRPLGWEMLSEMIQAGLTVGSHTRSHALLTSESPQKVRDETEGSRRALQMRLGVAVEQFAYPNGWFNSGTVDAVAAAGYRVAYTTCRHRDPRHPWLTVPRTLLWEGSSVNALGTFSSAIMSCQANGLFEMLAPCRQPHGN